MIAGRPCPQPPADGENKPDAAAMPAPSKPRGRPVTHGLSMMRRTFNKLGSRAIDRRTGVGRALAEWRNSLIDDLGGSDSVTTQQLGIVDLAVRTKLLVDSVDAYVLAMPSPINKRSRCLYPVVRERQALVSQLQSLLRDPGAGAPGQGTPGLEHLPGDERRSRPSRS